MSSAPVPLTIDGVDSRVTVFRVQDEVDAFVVRTRRLTVLIDTTGTPSQCRRILELVEDGPGAPPLVVVNTHADWDHVWGNAAVAGRAPIIAHSAGVTRLRAEEARGTLAEKRAGSNRFDEVELIEPTLTFEDSLVLHGGDLTLHLLHTPGHTADHMAIWVPELRLCIAGDAAEDPLPEVTDPTPANLRLLRESLRRLHDLRPTIVLPSHGETTDPELLTRNLAYFTTVTERVRAALHEPVPTGQAPPGLSFHDCVPGGRPLTAPMLDFYRMCHRKAIQAAGLANP